MTTTGREPRRGTRHLLGLRRGPGRLALAVMRMPLPLYRRGWGWLLGRTFLLITHEGRTTGRRHETVVMVLSYDLETQEAVVCSAWGPNAQWFRNLRAQPALRVQIGHESYIPEQRFLTEDESVAIASEFRRKNPGRLLLIAAILGLGDLSSEDALREFVRNRPLVAFQPALGDRVDSVVQSDGGN